METIIEKMDRLEHMFQLQLQLGKRVGVDVDVLDDEERMQWILSYTRAMQQEIAELVDSFPWKWWAKYQKFDLQNARVEVIDILHFLLAIAQTLGMSSEDIYETYVKKNQVNHQRQNSGYGEKDANDSRHI